MSNSQAKDIEEQIKLLKQQLESLQEEKKRQAGDENEEDGEILNKQENKTEEKEEGDAILIVVANRLPVSMQYIDNKWKFKPSAGGLVTALKQLGNLDMEWVGCPGYIEDTQREYIENKLNEYNVHPVFVEKRDYDNYYNGFCNGILWPLFHYIELNDEIVVPYFNKFYTSYSRINLLFAKAIDLLIKKLKKKHGSKKDILIWIHDYHLMLCPNYIRRIHRDAMIGFFLHIPFPTWEQFRILPKANNLLQGVLACNLIGFHIHDYAQHFRGACAHILQCELAPDSIIYHGRMSIISTHPIGTDINKWRQGLKQKEIQELIKKYQLVHKNKKIILGVDRLDFIKGIPHKLYAFNKFLEDNPDLRDKIVFIQIAVPSRQTAPEYIKLTKKCNELVGKINSKYSSFSSVPIHFLYQSFGFNDLVALYNISSVCYVTSLRDGMNLVSYEYISCQNIDNPGVLIISEFAGSAQSLGCGSIVINPWDIENCANALQTALKMDLKQRQTHQEILYKIISKNTVQHWANTFINTLQISYQKCPQNAPIVPSPCNLYSIQRAFSTFNNDNSTRLIVLGLGGTMIPSISKNSSLHLNEYSKMKKISSKIKEAINKLSSKCIVAILSSLPCKSIEILLKDIYCVQYAENGYFMRDYNLNSKNKQWQITTNYTDNSWKDEVLKIMKYFQERTPNTTLDDLTSFVSFRYNVSGGLNLRKSSNQSISSLSSTPSTTTTSFTSFTSTTNPASTTLLSSRNNISQCVTSLQTGPLQSSYARLVHDTSNGHIQVRQPGVSKLSSITRLIQKLSNNKPIDYILCIANFLSFDEEVFVYLNGLKEDDDDQQQYNSDNDPNNSSSTSEYSANDDNNISPSNLPRIGSSNSLAKMYPSTDIDQIKYSSKSQIELTKTNLISTNCVIDTIKVGRFATRAKHYVNDSKKVEELLYKLSQTIDDTNLVNSPTNNNNNFRGLSSMRNWSVNSDLSKLNEMDDDSGTMSPMIIMDRGVGGSAKLFGSYHDNMSPPTTIPPTAIPPTAAKMGDNDSSDYASLDDETIKQVEETKIESNKQGKLDNTVDID